MIRIIIALALLGALVCAIEWVPAHYISIGVQQERTTRAKADAEHLKADTAAALKAERAYAALQAKNEAARLKEREDHAKDKADAVARARAGGSGMRCPSAILQSNAAPASSAAAGPPGPSKDGGMVPGAAGDLLDAVGHGVQDVRDYNDLLDEYHKLDAFCKAK